MLALLAAAASATYMTQNSPSNAASAVELELIGYRALTEASPVSCAL